MMDSLAGAKIFSTLDAKTGYYQLTMSKDSIVRTAFGRKTL